MENTGNLKKGGINDFGKMAVSLLVSLIIVALFFGGVVANVTEAEETSISGGWELRRGDKTFENISLEEMTRIFDRMGRNEKVVLNHVLDLGGQDPMTLRIYARLSAVRVLVQDKVIYSFGVESVEKNKMVGSGYHFALLPTGCYGKMLTVEIIPSEEGALKSAPEISLIPADEAMAIFAGNRIFGTFSGIFMFAAGIFFIFLSIPAIYVDRSFYPLFLIGVFSCFAGTWCLASIKALQLFSGDITLNSVVEYLSMYILPIPVLILSRHFRRSASPAAKMLISWYTVLSIIFVTAAFILHVTGIKDVTQTVGIFHLMTLPLVTIFLFAGSSKWRRMKTSEKLFQTGLIFITGMVVMEMVIYYILNLIYEISTRINTVTTPLAVLILDMVLTLGFLMEIYDLRLKDAEREHLQSLAYKDQMTGFLNRGMCEKRFDELRESREDFVMLDMDLNGLKSVNDRYGHLMGDQYISVFSAITTRAFGGDKNLYRVGGDEFLYIDTKMTREELYKKVEFIKKLEKVLPRDNGMIFDVDASFGIAGSDEVSTGDPEDVYRLADERMYRMKRESRRER